MKAPPTSTYLSRRLWRGSDGAACEAISHVIDTPTCRGDRRRDLVRSAGKPAAALARRGAGQGDVQKPRHKKGVYELGWWAFKPLARP